MSTLQAFHDLSLGIFPFLANNTSTAAVTLTTASGGDPNDFNSVRLFLFKVFKASWAAIRAGSAFAKSSAQILALIVTSSSITFTFFSSSAAEVISIRIRDSYKIPLVPYLYIFILLFSYLTYKSYIFPSW